MDKKQYTKDINLYITDYIKFADAKAGTMFTFIGLSLGALFSLLKQSIDIINLSNFKIPLIILLLVLGAFSVIVATFTICYLFKTIKPKVDRSTDSLNSFPNIANFGSAEDYISKITELDENQIATEYSKHNWEISKVCLEKYQSMASAISSFKLFIISLILLLVYTTILYITK